MSLKAKDHFSKISIYRRARLIGLTALLTLGISCTHQGAPQKKGSDERQTVNPEKEKKPYSLPIEKYALSSQQIDTINKAEYMMIKECMAEFKLSYDRPPTSETEAYPNANYRRYGLISLKGAMEFGYHVPETSESREDPDSEERVALLGGTDATYKVNGRVVPQGGCVGQTKGKLRGKYQNQDGAETAQQISTSSFQQSLRMEPVKLVFSRWAQCMKSEGFSYSSPIEALTKADLTTQKPTKSEIRIATADVTCKNKTKLVQIWNSEEGRIQNQAIVRQDKVLKRLRKSHEMMINEAMKVISEKS